MAQPSSFLSTSTRLWSSSLPNPHLSQGEAQGTQSHHSSSHSPQSISAQSQEFTLLSNAGLGMDDPTLTETSRWRGC